MGTTLTATTCIMEVVHVNGSGYGLYCCVYFQTVTTHICQDGWFERGLSHTVTDSFEMVPDYDVSDSIK